MIFFIQKVMEDHLVWIIFTWKHSSVHIWNKSHAPWNFWIHHSITTGRKGDNIVYSYKSHPLCQKWITLYNLQVALSVSDTQHWLYAKLAIDNFFCYKQSIFDPRPKKLFSNCLVDGPLIFKHFERCYCLLEGHLEYLLHTFEMTSPKVSISLRFPLQKKSFSLFSQWIV